MTLNTTQIPESCLASVSGWADFLTINIIRWN